MSIILMFILGFLVFGFLVLVIDDSDAMTEHRSADAERRRHRIARSEALRESRERSERFRRNRARRHAQASYKRARDRLF